MDPNDTGIIDALADHIAEFSLFGLKGCKSRSTEGAIHA
jgi:hypothetical protein